MRTALTLTHVGFEGLGSLQPALQAAGFTVEPIDACTHDLRAIDPLQADLVVVLGGPIGVYETESYPFLAIEIELLRRRLAAQRPTLGICLGAQLMAAALGARVYPGALGKEIGWSALEAGPQADRHAWFAPLLEPALQVLHWHGDTFDLPPQAEHLARSAQYEHQAFAIGRHALGLQCHPEVITAELERWYVGHACELAQAGMDVGRLRAASQRSGPALQAAAGRVWRGWLHQAFAPAG